MSNALAELGLCGVFGVQMQRYPVAGQAGPLDKVRLADSDSGTVDAVTLCECVPVVVRPPLRRLRCNLGDFVVVFLHVTPPTETPCCAVRAFDKSRLD